MNLNKLYDKTYKRLGKYFGQKVLFNLYRPDYSIVDNTGTLIKAVQICIEPTNVGVEDQIPGAIYYIVMGERDQFQTGDLIIPQSDDGTNVKLTVLHKRDQSNVIALLTSDVGKIIEGQSSGSDNNIFTNVRYQPLSLLSPGSELVPILESAFNVPNKKVVIYNRSGLKQNQQFVDAAGNYYFILTFEEFQHCTVLSLKGENLT